MLIVAFANLLPKETYGLFRYILSLAGILSIFTLTGIKRAIGQAVASGHDGALKVGVRYQLRWNILLFIAFLLLGLYYLLNGNLQIAISLFVIGVSAPITTALSTYGAYLEGKRAFGPNNIFSAISTLVYVLGILTAIILSGEIVWLIFAYSITTLATNIFFYLRTLKILAPLNDDAGEAIKYGKKLTWIGLIAPIASQIDSIILTHFWGATQLAIYSLAQAIPNRANSFIKSLVDIGMPKFVIKKDEEMESIFFRRISQGLFIGALCSILYVLLVPYLFKYLIPQYIDSIFYSQLLAISLVFAMPNRYISLLLESQKLSRLIFINSLIVNIVKISLYIILGMLGGIIGLVIAYISISFVGMLINIFSWRYRKILYEKFGAEPVNSK